MISARQINHDDTSRRPDNDGSAEPFPYDEIDANLAAAEGRDPDSNDASDTNDAADMDPAFVALWQDLWTVLIDQVLPKPGRSINPLDVGIRTIALIHWVLPGAFGADGGSMKATAERVGITRQCMSIQMKRLSKVYGYKLPGQKDERRIAICAAAAKRTHERKKQLAEAPANIARALKRAEPFTAAGLPVPAQIRKPKTIE